MTETDGRRRAAGALEAQVMSVLWAAGRPLTPADVQVQLDSGLAYNTVQTILVRLADKQLVERAQLGRAHTYRPLRGEAESAAAQLRATLSGAGDPTEVLQQFAASLDPQEAQLLLDLLSQPPRGEA